MSPALLSLIDEMEKEQKSRGKQRIDWTLIGVWLGCAILCVWSWITTWSVLQLIFK